jgi:hypothetical protein
VGDRDWLSQVCVPIVLGREASLPPPESLRQESSSSYRSGSPTSKHGFDFGRRSHKRGSEDFRNTPLQDGESVVGVLKLINKNAYSGGSKGIAFRASDFEAATLLAAEVLQTSRSHFKQIKDASMLADDAARQIQKIFRKRFDVITLRRDQMRKNAASRKSLLRHMALVSTRSISEEPSTQAKHEAKHGHKHSKPSPKVATTAGASSISITAAPGHRQCDSTALSAQTESSTNGGSAERPCDAVSAAATLPFMESLPFVGSEYEVQTSDLAVESGPASSNEDVRSESSKSPHRKRYASRRRSYHRHGSPAAAHARTHASGELDDKQRDEQRDEAIVLSAFEALSDAPHGDTKPMNGKAAPAFLASSTSPAPTTPAAPLKSPKVSRETSKRTCTARRMSGGESPTRSRSRSSSRPGVTRTAGATLQSSRAVAAEWLEVASLTPQGTVKVKQVTNDADVIPAHFAEFL